MLDGIVVSINQYPPAPARAPSGSTSRQQGRRVRRPPFTAMGFGCGEHGFFFIAFVASESAVVGCTLPHPPFFLPWGLNAIFRTFFAPSENHVICKPLAGAPRPSLVPVALGCQRFVSFFVPSESNALGNPGHHHVHPSL